MRTMNQLWHDWNTWWFASGPPHALALMRIALGIFLFLVWGEFYPHIGMLLSAEGIMIPMYSEGFTTFIADWSPLLYHILFVTIFLFTIGAYLRMSAIVIFAITAHFYLLNLHPLLSTAHTILMFFILVIGLSGADRTLSFATWKKHRDVFAYEDVCLISQKIIAVQLCALYIGVSTQKLAILEWQGGDVLFYALQSPWATSFAWWIVGLSLPMIVYDIAVETVKLFQLILPVALWSKKYQLPFIAGAALFHLANTALFSMWEFLFFIPMYIAFLDPTATQSIVERYRRS